jgi:hypothetical protein
MVNSQVAVALARFPAFDAEALIVLVSHLADLVCARDGLAGTCPEPGSAEPAKDKKADQFPERPVLRAPSTPSSRPPRRTAST